MVTDNRSKTMLLCIVHVASLASPFSHHTQYYFLNGALYYDKYLLAGILFTQNVAIGREFLELSF
jgi:hypothetical protein